MARTCCNNGKRKTARKVYKAKEDGKGNGEDEKNAERRREKRGKKT